MIFERRHKERSYIYIINQPIGRRGKKDDNTDDAIPKVQHQHSVSLRT